MRPRGSRTTFDVLMLTTPGFTARAMSRKVSRPAIAVPGRTWASAAAVLAWAGTGLRTWEV